VDLAARGRADPVGRVTVADPGDMNRAAATAATAAVMAPAVLASRAVPVVRVGMIPVDPVGLGVLNPVVPVGMILVDPEGRLRAPNPVVRVRPGTRVATDLSLGRALPGRMSTRLHLTAALPHLMPALPHLTPADRRTPVDRRWDPTTRAVATCPEATRAVVTCPEATPAEATRAVAIRRAEATDPRSSSLPVSRGRHITVRTGACNRSRTLARQNV
jgi:hypothetical protein